MNHAAEEVHELPQEAHANDVVSDPRVFSAGLMTHQF